MLEIHLEVTTDGDGDGTATKALPRGRSYLLEAVDWIDGDFADGVDGTLKAVSRPFGADLTLLTLTDANNDAVYYPRVLAQDNAGADLDTAGDAQYTLQVVDGSLQLTVAQGGATKTGGCVVYLAEA